MVQHFSGGVQPYPTGVGVGSNCLFHIETYIICDFPVRGSGTPVPPLDAHLEWEYQLSRLYTHVVAILCLDNFTWS